MKKSRSIFARALSRWERVAEGEVRVGQHGPPKELESDLIRFEFLY
jgi:hypothetical protein